MLVELPPLALEGLRPLMSGFPGLHGCLDAVLEGAMGTAQADDAGRPAVALLRLDFCFLAGDAGSRAAEEAVRSLRRPATIVVSGPDWEPLLRRVWGDAIGTRTRVAFRAGPWDRVHLRSFVLDLPGGFAVERITAENVGRFADLTHDLVENYASLEEFLAKGVGFGVEHEGRFLSGCASFALSSRSLEFEIQTHPDFRRGGLASAAAAAMIEYCLDHGLEPCWDAHNDMSAALATKLGFVDATPYTVYELGPPPPPS